MNIGLPQFVGFTISGTISLALPAYFSAFPHGTISLSVTDLYLALPRGRGGFLRGFTCPVVLRCSATLNIFISLTGLSPSLVDLSRSFNYKNTQGDQSVYWSSKILQHSICNAHRLTHIKFGLFPVRSPLLRESLLLSFPRGTKMFQFSRYSSSLLCIHNEVLPHNR